MGRKRGEAHVPWPSVLGHGDWGLDELTASGRGGNACPVSTDSGSCFLSLVDNGGTVKGRVQNKGVLWSNSTQRAELQSGHSEKKGTP